MKNKLEELIKGNRLLQVLHDKVLDSKFYDEGLNLKIFNYILSYLESRPENEITPEKAYFKFIKSYNKDMKKFAETKKYPLEIDENRATPSRYEYDIILLFSCIFAAHRFRIMQLIDSNSNSIDNALFVGCGPGLEIELIKSKIKSIVAYDFSLDAFPQKQHPKVNFIEEYFDGSDTSQKYDAIYLIELLEHLDKPYQLLENCKNVLDNNGKIFLTTATNIPQFDHLYNFESSHKEFDEKIKDLGYKITFVEDIPHQSLTLDIKAKNRFYVLERNN